MSKLLKMYYDVSKIVLWGETDSSEEGAKPPRFILSFRDGNPRFVVYTGLSGKESVITFPCDAIHMTTIMNFLQDVANGEPNDRIEVGSYGTVWENNKPTKEKVSKGVLYIGKSKEGIVYFSVIAENKPKIIFPIKCSPYHSFRDREKNLIPDSVISKKMALGLADLVLDVIKTNIVNYTNEEYENGKKQTSTDPQGNFQVKNSSADKNQVSDLDDLAL